MKVKTLYGPSDEEIENLLKDGWKIQAAFSENIRSCPDYANNEQATVYFNQMVVIFSYGH